MMQRTPSAQGARVPWGGADGSSGRLPTGPDYAGRPTSIVGAPATRVRNTVAAFGP